MNLLDLLIPAAHAQAATPAAQGGGLMGFLPLLLMLPLMYFLLIRPQQKRMKEHREMIDKLANGDEVITSSGIAGVIREIGEQFVVVEVADNVRLRVQKGAIGHVLPKGTLKNL